MNLTYNWRNNSDNLAVGGRQPKFRKRRIGRAPRQRHIYQLQHKYGLSLSDFDTLMLNQYGCCKICDKPFEKNKRLTVDHNHQTGKVRGLLCTKCNVGLGHFNDCPILLKKALNYLLKADKLINGDKR